MDGLPHTKSTRRLVAVETEATIAPTSGRQSSDLSFKEDYYFRPKISIEKSIELSVSFKIIHWFHYTILENFPNANTEAKRLIRRTTFFNKFKFFHTKLILLSVTGLK